ncbi:Neurl1b [Symbiodinium necroappetens]|uniref:Neurl1b protein n=1 Tax=Symbiodinium necroappetens TaxID=1628268 RepID=A0A813BXF6_9DINO|nr:Neurl1b [Symbiodinium necroappetens]
MTKRCAESGLPDPSSKRTRKKADLADALRQACDPCFVPFGGSPPCRFPHANGVSQQAISAMKELVKSFTTMPRTLYRRKDVDLKQELRKICTSEAGVVKWCDFARVFQSFHPNVAIEAVSEIWAFLGGGEEQPLHTFFRYCLPRGERLPLVSLLSAEEEAKSMACADLEAHALSRADLSKAHAALAAEHAALDRAVLSVVVQSMSLGVPENRPEQSEQVKHPSRSCVWCRVEDADHLLVPCGHVCYCHGCVQKLRGEWKEKCPVCRRFYREVVRVFA